MGQLSAKANIPHTSPIFPYLSLSFPELNLCWEAFNREAEGFALTEDQFIRIIRSRGSASNTHETKPTATSPSPSGVVDEVALGKSLFRVFDNDENGLVDALEVLCTLAVTSAVPLREKLRYLMAAYDFDNDEQLSLDELALMFKSTCNGLCKVSDRSPPSMNEVESAAEMCFSLSKADASKPMAFVDICEAAIRSVEVSSWLNFYNVPVPLPQKVSPIKEEKPNSRVSPPPLAVRRVSGGSAWQRQALELEPSPSADTKPEQDFPSVTLDVCGVLRYGESPVPCFLGRNVVVMSASGIVTMYFVEQKEHKHFTQHGSSVTAIAVHEEKTVSATGGFDELFVWSVEEGDQGVDVLASLTLPKGRQVSSLAFDASGEFLLCATIDPSMDGTGSADIMVFEWRKWLLAVWSCSVAQRIDSVLWLSPDVFVAMRTPCETPLVFSKNCHGEHWKPHDGVRTSHGLLVCAAIAPQQDVGVARFLVGTMDGRITVWTGWRETYSWIAFKGHGVKSIHCMDGRVVAASETKGFSVWEEGETSFEQIHRCAPGFVSVHSIRLSSDKCTVAIGSGEGVHLWKFFDAVDEAEKLGESAHSKIKACCTSPRSNDIVCAVDECEAHMWQLSHSSWPACSHPLPGVPTCCELSFCGTFLAIGIAAPKARLVVLSVENKKMEEVCTVQTEPMDSITCLAFTPDKRTLIVGYSSGVVRSCKMRDLSAGNNRIKWKAEGLVANGLVALDVAVDSSYCITNTSDDDGIHVLRCDDLGNLEALSDAKDVEWETHRCLHSWSTLYDVDETCRCIAVRGSIAVRGNDQGRITLQHFPLVRDKRRLTYEWSSAALTQLVFSKDGNSLFALDSAGSLIRWHVDHVRSRSEYHAKEASEVPEIVHDSDLAWVESVVKPRRPPKPVQQTPCVTLSASQVHGWSFKSTFCNTVHYVHNDKSLVTDVVYPGGALLVSRSGEGEEKIISGARDCISAVEVNDLKTVIAVGDSSGYVQSKCASVSE